MVAAYLAGTYRPPTEAEMVRTIAADEHKYVGHFAHSPRHTQQVDYYDYERNMRKKELPAGRRRAEESGPIVLAGRAERAAAGVG